MADELVRRLSASVVLAGALTKIPHQQLLEVSAEQLGWIERRTAELSRCNPSVSNGSAHVWAQAVIDEGSAEQAIANMCDGLGRQDVTDRLCRLLPLKASIQVLRRARVPRDLLTEAQAKYFQVSAREVGAALDKWRSARVQLPARRLEASAYTLDLQKEIRELGNDGSWLPWDNGTSAAALRRIRPHFRSGFENRSRDELVEDLTRLHAFVVVKKELELTEKQHQKILRNFYDPSHRHASWTAGSIAEHLQRVLDETARSRLDAADLDTAWALPASLASTALFWRAAADLADARKARANSDLQRALPTLARFPTSIVYSLTRRQRRAWIEEVTLHGPILDLLHTGQHERNLVSVVLTQLQPPTRADPLEEKCRPEARSDFVSNLAKGQVHNGVVSKIVAYGAFVDLGGMNGLVHSSELGSKHFAHPSEVVHLGQQVTVEVLSVDLARKRIALSLRVDQESRLRQFACTHPIGQVVPGKVTKVVSFGAFVRVEDGIEGLVHTSEFAEPHVDAPEQVVSVGDELLVKVINIDLDRRRISLSLKQANTLEQRSPSSR